MLLKDKGIAFCGLACCVCGENETCAGCRNDGCENRDWCKNRSCCLEKGLSGCWECPDFPCQGTMLDKLRIRAFARFIREYGEAKFMDCMEANERAGIVYHYPGQLIGDYDVPQTEEEIMEMIIHGKPSP